MPWEDARRRAATAVARLPTESVPLAESLDRVLAEPLTARTDLPPFPTAAMDGWAVSGPPPWRLVGVALAGAPAPTVRGGTAVTIATGARLPDGAEGVLRREAGRIQTGDDGPVLIGPATPPGTDVRRQGGECRAGDVVAEAGLTATPALLGLAAAAGHDALPVTRPPTVQVLVLGDELLDRGVPDGGRVRDALGPLLPGWLARTGCRPLPPRRLGDTPDALIAALLGSPTADVVVTTGSTASGPVDHLHDVLAGLGAELLVDGVAVRPGHPMLLARLPDGRPLVGLPGNPLAAVSALLTLAGPLVDALLGRPDDECEVLLAEAVPSHPYDVRLVPVRDGRPLSHLGPAMLRSLTVADGLAVVPPRAGAPGLAVRMLRLPWPSPARVSAPTSSPS